MFSLFDALLNEAATQINAIDTVDDLEARTRVLDARASVPNDRLQFFTVTVPEDLTPDERKAFTRMVNEALEPVVRDALMDINHKRTWSGFDA